MSSQQRRLTVARRHLNLVIARWTLDRASLPGAVKRIADAAGQDPMTLAGERVRTMLWRLNIQP